MFLEKINSPQDIKNLSIEELNILALEIRQRIIEVVASTGGHLASSLGAVELIIALHYCLDTPYDKLIFDVGHQAYAHKILTGRNKNFPSLRQYQGISGFPSQEESIYDVFTTGHSSTAVSLALGLVCARDIIKDTKEDFKVVAVIGDGSLSGGLCFEGLNNAGHLQKDILVILNTNELSIAPNVGAISTYLNKLISLPIYNRFKEALERFARSRIPKGTRLLKIASKFEEGLKGLFIPGILFEELGFRYFGPIDGHNLQILIPTLRNILNIKGPRLLHVVTKKGKGYSPAENEPVRFHSASPFDIKSGLAITQKEKFLPTYTEVFRNKLIALARENQKIIALTAAMPEGTGLDKFRDLYPERFFDCGIAEEHVVCFAAGLAKAGLKPVVAIYSTFLQRAYDQIIEEVALQNLGVVFALDRAGIVGEDGPTHQGIFDIAFLRTIPNLALLAPKDGLELEAMLEFAINLDKPVAIRYPKDKVSKYQSSKASEKIQLGKAEVLKEGRDFIIIALGSMVEPSLEAVKLLEKEGLSGTLINARFVNPLDLELVKELAKREKPIFTVEEGVLAGGFGSSVAEAIDKPLKRIGLPSEFIPHGKREILLVKYGLDCTGIAKRIKELIKNG
ncbi:MAG: 1-deoxy-D-xylulose-5-phosphate synthase [Candidatus Omnitrophica bacterium]|nr:1-deoxy-D-xylulose-5-phosphate synthase [Candidatus Omnitrophota bacterium]